MKGSQVSASRWALILMGWLPFILFTPDSQAFVLISNGGKVARWPDGRVEYYYKDISSSWRNAVEASFDAWANISGVDLNFVSKGNSSSAGSRDGRNVISFVGDEWTSLSFRPPSNALAVTLSSFSPSDGAIIDADIYFNDDDFDWGIVQDEDDLDLVDVQNIATHEIGHMIGIDHSSMNFFETDQELAEATMFYASGAGETSRRVPKIDDERAVRALYPSSELEAATIASAEEIDRIGRTVLYRVQGTNFGELTSFIMASESFSMGDIVARYKTILSSTEAEVEFNLAGFYDLTPQFMVFNGAGNPSAISFQLDRALLGSSAYSADADSSGGGCSSRPNSRGIDLLWVVLLLVVMGITFRPTFGFSRRLL
jgi:hypothetical protein